MNWLSFYNVNFSSRSNCWCWPLFILLLLVERKSVAIFGQKSIENHRWFGECAHCISRIYTFVASIVRTSWRLKSFRFWFPYTPVSSRIIVRFEIFWVGAMISGQIRRRTLLDTIGWRWAGRWYIWIGSFSGQFFSTVFKIAARRLNIFYIVNERGRFLAIFGELISSLD